MIRSTMFLTISVTILAVCMPVGVQAADDPSPTWQTKLNEATAQIKAKDLDTAEKTLLALAKEKGLDNTAKATVCLKLMDLYGLKGERSEQVEYAKKTLAIRNCDAAIRTKALVCLVERSAFGARFMAEYMEMRPEKDVRRLQQDHLKYLQELVKLDPENGEYLVALGEAYLLKGEADKAMKQFNAALALPELPAFQQGFALTGLAGAALLKGDRAAAMKYCEDLASRNIETRARYRLNPVEEAKYALQYLDEPDLDYLKLPWFTDAKAFPTPQQAEYTEKFIPLKKVKLVPGKDIKPDDARLRLLKVKFNRFGIEFSDNAPFTIRINTETDPRAPDKPEGYALTVSKAGAVINGNDPQGVLWGIVSLIQLVNAEGEPKIRVCSILDWPDTARRGFLQGYWKDALEFMLFCKMNTVVSQNGVQITDAASFQPWTPLQKEICRKVCETFKGFGLRHYFGIRQRTMYPKLPLSSDRTFDLHVELCSEVAKYGGDIYFPYDDSRYPMHKADIEKFGTAANMDAKYVTRLFEAVRKEHADFHLVFCPPFYWGPDAPAAYPEPREPYLKSLGEYLDPRVEVIWTGPRVKGYKKTKEHVEWFVKLTKHKPMIFQNGTGPHNLLSYITDETPEWKTWHYEGFFKKDIEGFLKNAHMGMEAPQTTTLADCLWNVGAYDPAASIRRGVAMLYGKNMFDILDPANKALAYLDKYKYGRLTPEAITEIPEIERRIKIADAAYNKGVEYNSFSLENFPGALGRGVDFAKTLLARAKKAPDFYKKYADDIDKTHALAVEQVKFNKEKGDIFKSPVDLIGGQLIVYDNRCPKRFAGLIRGQGTTISTARTRFECDPFPASGDYKLFVCAQDDDAEAPCKIRIAVNGKPIFEGPSPFVRYGWSVEEFTIPFDHMQRNNTLTIENLEDTSTTSGPPWFMINYAVIRKNDG